jgi:hypothetical protein
MNRNIIWEDVLLGGVGGRPFHDLQLCLEHPVPASQLDQLPLLRRGQPLRPAAVDGVLGDPAAQTGLSDAEIPGHLGDLRVRLGRELNSSTTVLLRIRSRHSEPSSRRRRER